jgi:hypothetical protein
MDKLTTDRMPIGLAETAGNALTVVGIRWYDLPFLVIVLAIICILLVQACGILLIRGRNRKRRIATAEAAFAKTFGRDRVYLQEVPGHLEELDRRIVELMRDYEQLRRARGPRRIEPGRNRTPLLELLGQLHKDALEEVGRISGDAEFARIDEVLHIRPALAELGTRLSQLEEAVDLPKLLLTDLESSDAWNAALTTPNILEGYFDGTEKLRPLARRLRAIEQVLNAAFLRLDVEILLKRPFSVVDANDAAIRAKEAPRDLFSLRSVQEQAARRAQSVADRSPIVLDCFAPGWNSTRIGRRLPRFTIYDPSH